MSVLGRLGVCLLAAVTVACSKAPQPFKNTDIIGAGYAGALALPDTEGRTRTLLDFRGTVVVLFFGFTQCPDVCPTVLAQLAELKRSLGKDGDRVQVVLVTVTRSATRLSC